MSGGRERRIVVGGLPFFGRRLAALLNGPGWQVRYLETRAWQPRAALTALRLAADADLVYLVGGQLARHSRPDLLRAIVRAPVLMHWAGSDVLHARRAVRAGHVSERLRRGVVHWTGAPWLADELAALGVRARWLPHSWVDQAAPPPLPGPEQPFTILAYLPEGRSAFYGAAAVRAAAAALPEARLLVVGCDRLPEGMPANVRALGWVEAMAPVFAECHALLRLPRHDGLAFMVQEALALGRYAVWSHPFAGAYEAHSHADALAILRDLVARHTAGALPLNEAGAAHVRKRFSADRIRAELLAGFEQVLARDGPDPRSQLPIL